ncbi:hypothetical protein [Kitasatospora sp. NPDC002040]|uniref:hypothetical protein n=1 Tax=Kitasatospora sp. NPDC002040 TaxID=3154661 RepID=UPI003329EE4C
MDTARSTARESIADLLASGRTAGEADVSGTIVRIDVRIDVRTTQAEHDWARVTLDDGTGQFANPIPSLEQLAADAAHDAAHRAASSAARLPRGRGNETGAPAPLLVS